METIELSDNKILEIIQDQDPESPREWDNLGTMACFHGRYNLGDKNIPFHTDDFNSWDEMRTYIENKLRAVIVLPLYLYDHSGITISTSSFSCSWDSGQVGFIYVTEDDILKGFGVINDATIVRAEAILENEVITYDQYLTGDIYGFRLLKKSVCDQGHIHEEVIDSCWGFYGSDIKTNGILDYVPLNEEDREIIDSL